jgi:hypothetical protein
MLIGFLKGEPTAQTHIIKQSHNQLPNVRPAHQQTITSQVSFSEFPSSALVAWLFNTRTKVNKFNPLYHLTKQVIGICSTCAVYTQIAHKSIRKFNFFKFFFNQALFKEAKPSVRAP